MKRLYSFTVTFIATPVLMECFSGIRCNACHRVLCMCADLLALFAVNLPDIFTCFVPELGANRRGRLVSELAFIFLYLNTIFSVTLFVFSSLVTRLLGGPRLSFNLGLFSPFPLFALPAVNMRKVCATVREAGRVTVCRIFSGVLVFIFVISPMIV